MGDDWTDQALLSRLRDDPAALECLYRRHVARVMSYAVRRLDQPADIADLVAATFLAVLESARTYDPSRGDVLPWIIGIARRIEATRRWRLGREQAASMRVASWRDLHGDDITRIEGLVDQARFDRQMESALACLSSAHREAIWLVGVDGLRPEEAAAVVGVSAAAFRMRLSRGRRALARALGDAAGLKAAGRRKAPGGLRLSGDRTVVACSTAAGEVTP